VTTIQHVARIVSIPGILGIMIFVYTFKLESSISSKFS